MKEAAVDGSPAGITDKGEFIHYTFERFHCPTQRSTNQAQLTTAQQVNQEMSARNSSRTGSSMNDNL